MNDADPFYEASIKRVFKKPQAKIRRHGQKIKAAETVLTCDCKPLEANKKYLVFGRETQFTKTLYFDVYSIGYETDTREQKKLVREFRKLYRTIKCPPLFRLMFGENVWQNKHH
jgi:UNC-6/NTR/C345C module.